jgi:hypothetical protein
VGDHHVIHNPSSEVRRETPFFVPTLLDRNQSGNTHEQEVAISDVGSAVLDESDVLSDRSCLGAAFTDPAVPGVVDVFPLGTVR